MPIIPAQISTSVELNENGSYNIAQYTMATVDVQPTISPLGVTPTTSAQNITIPSDIDGYGPITVAAVDNTIDANIVPGNIKKDVTILGVTGTHEGGGGGDTLSLPLMYYDGYYGLELRHSTEATQTIDLSQVVVINGYTLYEAYLGSKISGHIDMHSLAYVGEAGLWSTFEGTAISSFDLSGLGIVDSSFVNAFRRTFAACPNLTEANFPGLEVIDTQVQTTAAFYQMFSYCENLKTIRFTSLSTVGNYAFSYMLRYVGPVFESGSLDVYFPSLTPDSFVSYNMGTAQKNVFRNMCTDSYATPTLHFPENMETAVSAQNTYAAGFGNTNTIILFDLPATTPLTGADGRVYTRSARDDTSTCTGWRYTYGTGEEGLVPYYVSGTSSPVVGDTIYSDAACTTAATTITAIA